MSEELKYPIVFKSCPVCGCETTIIQVETEKEIEKGNIAKDKKTPVMVTKTYIFDAQQASTGLIAKRQVPLLMGFFDVCTNCGTIYCREMQKQAAILEPHAKKTGPGGNDGSSGLGPGIPFIGKG